MNEQKPRMRASSTGQLTFSDSLTNVVSGLGTERDKRSHNTFRYNPLNYFDWIELESAYADCWLATSIVDIPVDDATREWRSFSCEEASDIQRAEKHYKVQQVIQEAFKWSRLYGGAAILMITDQDLSMPLDTRRLKQGSLKRLVVLDRRYITGVDFNFTDPTIPNYLLPNKYMVAGGSLNIHHSHVIRIPGQKIPLALRQLNGGWDNSVLRKCMEDIKDAVSAKAGIASLIQEANVDVIEREGLSDELTTEDGSNAILKRYQLAGTLKAINRMLLLDGTTEKYSRNPASFGGLGDVLDKLMMWTSGAADIPMTRLFGEMAKGMGDSGAGDQKNYNNAIRGQQESAYREVLERIDEVMIPSWLGEMPEECEFEFNPLSQPSGAEQAQQELANSQADDNYLASGVVKKSQVMRKLQSRGTYSISDDDIEEAKKAEKEEANGAFDPEGDNEGAEMTADAWSESDHPRDVDGKFSSGGNGQTSAKKKPSDIAKQSRSLTENQSIILKDYKEGGYKALNDYLLNGDGKSTGFNAEARTIDQSIKKSSLSEPAVLYRGIKARGLAAAAESLVGKEGSFNTFASTSLDIQVASSFSGSSREHSAIFAIEAPTGTNALDMDQFEVAGSSGESEILLGRNQKYLITGVSRTNNGITVINAKLISSSGTKDSAPEVRIMDVMIDDSRFVISEQELEKGFGYK